MDKVWILFSVANEYYQPSKAFEALWRYEPTYTDLKVYGFSIEEAKALSKQNIGGCGKYWVEVL